MIKDKYNFFSGNIPVNVTIESDKNDFVYIYKVSVSQISSNTELVLDKIRDELVDKVKLSVADITDPKKKDYKKIFPRDIRGDKRLLYNLFNAQELWAWES